MKSRPIIFSVPMVRAILAGSKTQTRRAVNPQPEVRPGMNCTRLLFFRRGGEVLMDVPAGSDLIPSVCPYGKPGDVLWVKEEWRVAGQHDDKKPSELHERKMTVFFEAGGSIART